MVVVSDKQPFTLRAAHNISSALVLLKAASRCAMSRDGSALSDRVVVPSASSFSSPTSASFAQAPAVAAAPQQVDQVVTAAVSPHVPQVSAPVSAQGLAGNHASALSSVAPAAKPVTVNSASLVAPVISTAPSPVTHVTSAAPEPMAPDNSAASVAPATSTKAKATTKGQGKKAARQSVSAAATGKRNTAATKTTVSASSALDSNASLLEAAGRASSSNSADNSAPRKIQVEVIATKQESGIKVIQGRKAIEGAGAVNCAEAAPADPVATTSVAASTATVAHSQLEATQTEGSVVKHNTEMAAGAGVAQEQGVVSQDKVAPSTVAQGATKSVSAVSGEGLSDREGREADAQATKAQTILPPQAQADELKAEKASSIQSVHAAHTNAKATSSAAERATVSAQEPVVVDSFTNLLPDEEVIGAPETSLISAGGALGLNHKGLDLNVTSVAITPAVTPAKASKEALGVDGADSSGAKADSISGSSNSGSGSDALVVASSSALLQAEGVASSSLTVTPSSSSALFAQPAGLGLEIVSAVGGAGNSQAAVTANAVTPVSTATTDFAASSDLCTLSGLSSLSSLSKLSDLSALSTVPTLTPLPTGAGAVIKPLSVTKDDEQEVKPSGSLSLTGLS